MADDLDGVSLSSAVRQYNPGDQYRVKETDPDESGGGRDFYDGFMRKKKQEAEGDKPESAPAEASGEEPVNPIPVVEQVIQDDVVLSRRAKHFMEQFDPKEPECAKPPPDQEGGAKPSGHIKVQA